MSSRPSYPKVASPQAKTCPSFDKAIECESPHERATIKTFWSDSIFLGTGMKGHESTSSGI